MRVNKRILGAEKVNYKQQTTIHHLPKRIVSEALAPIVSTLRHPMLKSASEAPHLILRATIIIPLHGKTR